MKSITRRQIDYKTTFADRRVTKSVHKTTSI